ncbi:hypothetical protein HMPREF1400_00864 [Helicobacter pylori GAM119Bi]|nr:hypothetical protein HMPREF1400_00864 [Helicobacter pylori GAM119Bi]
MSNSFQYLRIHNGKKMRFNFQRAYDRQSCQSCEQQKQASLTP